MADNNLEKFTDYLSVEKGSAKNTIESYERDIKKFLEFLKLKQVSPLKASMEDINIFIAYLKDDRKLEPSSIARLVAAVRGFYKFLEDEEIIIDSPFKILHAPKLIRHLPDVLAPQEIISIIEQAKKDDPISLRDRTMLEFLYSAGLRISELLELKLSNITLDEDGGFLRFFGKGSKERITRIGVPAKEALNIYLTNARPILKKSKDTEFVFLNKRGSKLSRMGGWKIVIKYVKLSGIKKKVTPHTFRHSFATSLLEGSADLRTVQELLGHSSITTTEIYTHIDRERLKEAVRNYHPRG